MVTFARGRVVFLCGIVLATSCGRQSAGPSVKSEPRHADSLRANSPEVAAHGKSGAHWPAAQVESGTRSTVEATQSTKSGSGNLARDKSQEYDTYSPPPVPERRPGLATQYGERRDSAITEVPFDRLDETRAQAVLSLFYDDESGVEAKSGRDARDALPSVFRVRGGAVEVSIVSSWDNPLPHLLANGRTFIIGESSDRYAIRLTNRSRERYEVVASVDGLDVISGTEATQRHHGYILAPWSTLRIEGFRESMDSVRAFRFGKPSDSYAVGRGFGRDIGVIGVALFDERTYRPRSPEPNPFPGRFAPPPAY